LNNATPKRCEACTVTACATGTYQSAACSTNADRVCTPNCGNGLLDAGEGCDETTSGQCTACRCTAGFVLGADLTCQDVNECGLYTCGFLDAEGEDRVVDCEEPAANIRVCTCKEGDVFGEAAGVTFLELVGLAAFPGCQSADVPTADSVIAQVISTPALVETLLNQIVPGASNVVVSAGSVVGEVVITFSVPDGADVSMVVEELRSMFAAISGLDVSQITVTLVPTAKRVQSYTATVTFADASPAGHVMIPLVALASALFYQLF